VVLLREGSAARRLAQISPIAEAPRPLLYPSILQAFGAAWGQAAEGSALTIPAYRAEPLLYGFCPTGCRFALLASSHRCGHVI